VANTKNGPNRPLVLPLAAGLAFIVVGISGITSASRSLSVGTMAPIVLLVVGAAALLAQAAKRTAAKKTAGATE